MYKMTSEFQNHTKRDFQGNLPPLKTGHANQSTGAINMLKRDRFELLSAYLDGEVTAAEKRQVEDWLACDPAVQRLYARLLKLRQGLRAIPVPPEEQPVEQTIEQVYARIDRRWSRARVWGGAAIAALFVGALSSVLPSRQFIAPQLASAPEPATASAETLMVALNTPVVEIPKAAVAAPEKVD
jgi:anti-sigma factor RsiW